MPLDFFPLMSDSPIIQATIDLGDSTLECEVVSALTQQFRPQLQELMRELDENDTVHLVRDLEAPAQSKSGSGAEVPGKLSAELSLPNLKPIVEFIWTRLVGKTYKLNLKVKDVELGLEVGSQKDLATAMRDVEQLIARISERAE
jgi:hypothetical protein